MVIDPLSLNISRIFSPKSEAKKKGRVARASEEGDQSVSFEEQEEKSFFHQFRVKKVKKDLADDKGKRRLIAKWIGELERRGEALSHAPSMKSFVLYRSVLENILNLATDAYDVEVARHANNDGRTKEYLKIKVVSKELDSLLSLIRERTASPLSIANKVISIKGLVVDLFS